MVELKVFLQGAHCVMHVHTTPTMAVCCLEDGLSYTNFYAAQLYGKVAYHEFEGITVHADEGERILASAGGKPVLMLRNHGPVTIGATLPDARRRPVRPRGDAGLRHPRGGADRSARGARRSAARGP